MAFSGYKNNSPHKNSTQTEIKKTVGVPQGQGWGLRAAQSRECLLCVLLGNKTSRLCTLTGH